MQVSIKNNKLLLEFHYNAVIVEIVGNFEGRRFNNKTKCWTVPLVVVGLVVDTLTPYGFTFSDDVVELYINEVKKKKRLQRLSEGNFNKAETEILESLKLPLFRYQQIGAGFMTAAESCLCGDQPGLGKTIQTIAVARIKKMKKVLVFCPLSVKRTWQEELERWAPGMTSIIIKGTPKQRAVQWEQDVDVYICNYHLLLRDLPIMLETEWDLVVADEATVIANGQAKTTKALKKLNTKRKIALTGTPISNSVEDIWSAMDWIAKGRLGTHLQFINNHCTRDGSGFVNGYKNLDVLREKLAPYMIRRLKRDVLTELPPKLYEKRYVEFTAAERVMYEKIKEKIVSDLIAAGMYNTRYLGNALVKMTRLTQMTQSQELINGTGVSAKLEALKELLRTVMQNDEKAIIFTVFKEMALILMRELAEYNPVLIAGGVDEDQREINRKQFNEDDTHRLLIMTSAGSMGLNLQRASAVIHYDVPQSVREAEQREDRAHRQGQTGNVTVYNMLVQDSIDERSFARLQKKKETSIDVLGDEQVTEAANFLTFDDVKSILS